MEKTKKKDTTIRIPLRLECIKNIDKDGTVVKNDAGNATYIRHDATALSQIISSTNSQTVSVEEYKDLIALSDKSNEAVVNEAKTIVLNVGEAALLKKLLSNTKNEKAAFTIFHIRTISAVLEQLK